MRLTNPLWYLAAVAIALVGSMIGTAVAASAWEGVREARIAPATEPIDADGRTLAIFTDQDQGEREIECTTRPTDDPEAEGTAIREAALDLSVEHQGATWHLLALEPRGDDGMLVSCLPTDGESDAALYGYAVVDGFEKASRGSTIGGTSLVVAVAFAGLVFWQRRRARIHGDDTTGPSDSTK